MLIWPLAWDPAPLRPNSPSRRELAASEPETYTADRAASNRAHEAPWFGDPNGPQPVRDTSACAQAVNCKPGTSIDHIGRTRSGLRLLTRSLAQMRRRCPAMHVDDLGATCRTLRVKIRTSDSIALGLTRSSLWDHGVSVRAAELVQARVRWRILLEEILLCRVASTIAPESEISPSMASRAWMPCKLVCSGRSRPVPLKSPRTLRKRGQPAHFAQEGLLKESCSM